MEKATFSKKEAAAYLGIGLTTLQRLIQAGEIPVVKLARRVLIRKETLDRFLQARERRQHHNKEVMDGQETAGAGEATQES